MSYLLHFGKLKKQTVPQSKAEKTCCLLTIHCSGPIPLQSYCAPQSNKQQMAGTVSKSIWDQEEPIPWNSKRSSHNRLIPGFYATDFWKGRGYWTSPVVTEGSSFASYIKFWLTLYWYQLAILS